MIQSNAIQSSAIQSKASDPGDLKEAKLPRRDWILLPLLSLLTIGIIAVSTELIARRMFTEWVSGTERCKVSSDPFTGVERISSCVYWGKEFETQPTEYHFNSSGYRDDVEFGAKSPGTYRIALVGSSVGAGGGTPSAKTFAVTLPAELSERTGHAVELYNEAIPGVPGLPQSLALRFKDVLATQPDLVLWVLTRWDVKEASSALPGPEAPVEHPAVGGEAWPRVKEDLARGAIRDAASGLWGLVRGLLASTKQAFQDSRTAFLLQHDLYGSQSVYVKYSLSGPDEFAGYLRAEPSAEWQSRLRAFDVYVANIQAQAQAAGVTLAVVLVPSRPQAAMISMGDWPAGFDPYTLDDELRSIVVSHGATYIDIFPGFRDIPNPEQYYFAVDGHPSPDGQAIISRLLAAGLSGGAVPALKAATAPQAAWMRAR